MGVWEAEIGRDEEREGDDRSGYVGVRDGEGQGRREVVQDRNGVEKN